MSGVMSGVKQITYTVQPGDTLDRIAREHGSTAEILAQYNPHLTDQVKGERPRDEHGNKIYAGDDVFIVTKEQVKNVELVERVMWYGGTNRFTGATLEKLKEKLTPAMVGDYLSIELLRKSRK